jgi:ABC-type phosphate/phosphonate transport system substrate-binding protein
MESTHPTGSGGVGAAYSLTELFGADGYKPLQGQEVKYKQMQSMGPNARGGRKAPRFETPGLFSGRERFAFDMHHHGNCFFSRMLTIIHCSTAYKLMLFLGLFLPWSLIAQVKNPELAAQKNEIGHIAILAETIEGAINQDDALAKAKVWCETVFMGTGFKKTEAQVIKEAASAVAMLNANELDVIGMPTYQYVEFEKSMNADPVLTYVHNGKVAVEYVLVVNNDAKIADLKSLKEKRITLSINGISVMTRLWCDSLLMKTGITGGMESFFKEVKEVQKANQAILPVFFGQKEAAIVTRSALDTAIVLNPQIGNKLKILALSPPFVPMVACIRRSLDPSFKSKITSKALSLHQTASGLQSFTLFKIDQFKLWESSFADSTRILMKQIKDMTANKSKTEQRLSSGRRN